MCKTVRPGPGAEIVLVRLDARKSTSLQTFSDENCIGTWATGHEISRQLHQSAVQEDENIGISEVDNRKPPITSQ